MLRRLFAVGWILAALYVGANAEFNGCPRSLCNPNGGNTSLYTGPGDVVTGAYAFWGLRPYNNAYAQTQGPLALVCMPSDSACANITTTIYGQINFPAGLTCNNSGSVCTIKTLYDTSGAFGCAGNGSRCDVTQATIANRPTLVVPGAANGCPNTADYCINNTTITTAGLQAVAISGNDQGIGSQPFAIATVLKQTSVAGNTSIFSNNTSPGNGQIFLSLDTSGRINMFAGTPSAVLAIALNTWFGVVIQLNTSSTAIYANATSGTGLTTGNQVLGGGKQFEIGFDASNTANTAFWTEIQIVQQSPLLNSTLAASLISNQRAYWNF